MGIDRSQAKLFEEYVRTYPCPNAATCRVYAAIVAERQAAADAKCHVKERTPILGKQLTFSLTREQFEAKRSDLAAKGFALTGDSGETPRFEGITLDYAYSEPTQTLTVSVASHPLLKPEWAIDQAIQQYLGGQ